MSIIERIDEITHIPGEYLNTVVPAPKSVKIELTGRCNYKCTFCARSDKLREQKEMDWDLFQRLLVEMHDAGVKELGLFYLGESFMDKRLEEAIRFAKQDVGYEYVFLTTNGSLATAERVESCIRNGLDSLKFSLNYADEDQFEEIARVKRDQFQKMLTNIKNAKAIRDRVEAEIGQHCGLYASYIDFDGHQGERMLRMVDEMRPYLDEVYSLPLYGQSGPQSSPVRKGMKEVVVSGGNTGRLKNPVPALPCWATLTEGHITWDGKMSACCWDHNDGLTMGDLTKQSFMEAWNSEKFQQLRRAHLQRDVSGTVCAKCIYGE